MAAKTILMKLQDPITKLQRSSNSQALKISVVRSFEVWSLEFLWMLELGAWNL
jgi:hypothetical protein